MLARIFHETIKEGYTLRYPEMLYARVFIHALCEFTLLRDALRRWKRARSAVPIKRACEPRAIDRGKHTTLTSMHIRFCRINYNVSQRHANPLLDKLKCPEGSHQPREREIHTRQRCIYISLHAKLRISLSEITSSDSVSWFPSDSIELFDWLFGSVPPMHLSDRNWTRFLMNANLFREFRTNDLWNWYAVEYLCHSMCPRI